MGAGGFVMRRLDAYLLLSACLSILPIQAQQYGSQPQAGRCPGTCPPWEPISGHVTDAVTGKPVANALVRYGGTGDVGKPSHVEDGAVVYLGTVDSVNPPSIHGEVRSGEDGTFTLPQLGVRGFEVRVSASGYVSARQFLSEHPAGYRPHPPPPMPTDFCMARYGKPDCTAPIVVYDGNFALQPTSVELKQMGSKAQAVFGLPKDNPIQIPRIWAAAISPNGQHLALLGPPGGSAVPSPCTGWIYDIATDRLQRIEPEIPSKYCDGLPPKMQWKNDIVLLRTSGFLPQSASLVWETETMRWQDGNAEVISVDRQENMPNPAPEGFKTTGNETVLDKTDDGQFVVVDVEEDCRQCQQTLVLSSQRDWKMKIEDSVFSGYLLDPAEDVLITIPAENTRQKPQTMTLEIVNLKTRQQENYVVPPSGGRSHLLAMQPLSEGKVSVAYTTDGGCDPFGPAAPFDPPAGSPMPMFRESLCIAVLPANRDEQIPAQH